MLTELSEIFPTKLLYFLHFLYKTYPLINLQNIFLIQEPLITSLIRYQFVIIEHRNY